MREYDISTYGDTAADVYDDWYQDRDDLGPIVTLLAELAAGGKALELGIGTGRVALPLAERGGVFLIELFVAVLGRFDRGQRPEAVSVEVDRVDLNVERHDPVAQRLTSQHVVFSEEGTRLYPVQGRYVWPSELDLMAMLAGLRLRHRWSDWRRSAFTGTSVSHISVYEKE